MNQEPIYLGYQTESTSKDGKTMYISTATIYLNGLEYRASELGSTIKESENNAKKVLEEIVNKKWDKRSNHQFGSVSSTPTVPKDELRGGGSKPITEKQASLIRKLAFDKNLNLEEFIFHKFGKSLGALTGAEADALIKELNHNNR